MTFIVPTPSISSSCNTCVNTNLEKTRGVYDDLYVYENN